MSLSTKVLFFCFSSLLLLPCQKTLVFRFFSINSQVILKNSRPLASNFSILLSNLLKKISIQEFYDTETTTARRKQKNKTLVDRKQLIQVLYEFVCVFLTPNLCSGLRVIHSPQLIKKEFAFLCILPRRRHRGGGIRTRDLSGYGWTLYRCAT